MLSSAVRYTLRVVAIVTIMVGLILTAQAAIATIALSDIAETGGARVPFRATLELGSVGWYAIGAQAVTVLAGLVLYVLSGVLTAWITR
jgi:hypothetical protein